jgi:hypothetical protein
MEGFQNYPPKIPKLVLSFGIDQAILSSVKEDMTENDFTIAVKTAYALVYDQSSIDKALPGILQRVGERVQELVTPSEAKASTKRGKSLGSALSDWLTSLSTFQLCLFIADFDIERASNYYWKEDMLIVQAAAELKAESLSQQVLVGYEQYLYANGGHYSDDAPREGNTFNLTSGEGKAALASLGF